MAGLLIDMSYLYPLRFAGFYAYNKAIAFNIVTADVYHAFGLRTASDFTAGLLRGWTFDAGRVVDSNITSEANTGGKLRIVCSAAHGLVNGDVVTVHLPNESTRYERAGRGHHHHFRCERCGQVFELRATCPVAVLEGVTLPGGFEVRGHALTLYGLCPECRAAPGRP